MFKWLLVSLLPAVIAAQALFAPGFIPTHDGEYHLIRFHEFETVLKSGNLFPRWAPDLNSGYGVPLFNFHYPLPNYAGALFHMMGASFADAVKLVLAVGYLGAVVFCFFWLSKLFDARAASVGTIVFAFVPYWFVDVYVRAVVGEVLALAWVMLALAGIERRRTRMTAVAVGLVIVSHNILSLLFLPVLFFYAFIRRRLSVTSFIAGIGLAGYFWIPALLERSYVTGLNSVDFRDHFPDLIGLLFPSWGTGFSGPGNPSGEMSFQIGIVPIAVLFVSLIMLIRRKKNAPALFFLILCGIGFLLMQGGLRWIWDLLPFLQYIQYPWRLLSFFIPASGFFAAYIVSQTQNRFLQISLAAGAVLLTYSYTRPVVYAPRPDVYYLSRPNFTDGTSSLGNSFSTRWSDWKKERPVSKVEVVNGEAIVSVLTTSPERYDFTIRAISESRIRVNTLYYPGWEVTLGGKPVPIDHQSDGTITFLVPAGEWKTTVHFGETPLRRVADGISLASLSWLVLSVILNFNAHRNRRHSAFKRA